MHANAVEGLLAPSHVSTQHAMDLRLGYTRSKLYQHPSCHKLALTWRANVGLLPQNSEAIEKKADQYTCGMVQGSIHEHLPDHSKVTPRDFVRMARSPGAGGDGVFQEWQEKAAHSVAILDCELVYDSTPRNATLNTKDYESLFSLL
jgi:hypothetical protein